LTNNYAARKPQAKPRGIVQQTTYEILAKRESNLAYFLRVGVDSTSVRDTGGFHAPIFSDNTFEFIPVPAKNKGPSNSADREYCIHL
jgi:hypothetical protein